MQASKANGKKNSFGGLTSWSRERAVLLLIAHFFLIVACYVDGRLTGDVNSEDLVRKCKEWISNFKLIAKDVPVPVSTSEDVG